MRPAQRYGSRSNELAAKRGLIVYEDICQAIFSEYKGRLVGTLGTASAFSLDSEKTFSSDKGGCIATDDDELAEKVRFLSSGRAGVDVPHFGRTHTAFGHAYDMSRMTAAAVLGSTGNHPRSGGQDRPHRAADHGQALLY